MRLGRTKHGKGRDQECDSKRRPRDVEATQTAGLAALFTNGTTQTRKQEERACDMSETVIKLVTQADRYDFHSPATTKNAIATFIEFFGWQVQE